MIGWSPYLTKLYGFENQMEFDNKYTPIQTKWNRVMGRIANGDNITDNNKSVIKEIEECGYNPHELAKLYKINQK